MGKPRESVERKETLGGRGTVAPMTSRETGCLFCRKAAEHSPVEGRVVYEDEYFLASHHFDDEAHSLLGVVLIQTKRHVNDLSELDPAEAERPGLLVRDVSRALKATMGASWTYCYSFLEGVRHVHVFVTARYPGVPPRYVRLNIGSWPEAPFGGTEEVNELATRLRALLSPPRTRR